jgi:hypothetical protein
MRVLAKWRENAPTPTKRTKMNLKMAVDLKRDFKLWGAKMRGKTPTGGRFWGVEPEGVGFLPDPRRRRRSTVREKNG